MDNLNSRCNSATEEYKIKYDKLLSLVNGYEIANDTQNESMKSLADIISNTKELISESEFETLKKEQKNIMSDFAKLEEMKNDPYSGDSIDFTSVKEEEVSKQKNKEKPKRFMEETIEEEEEVSKQKNKERPKRFMEETIEEEEEVSKQKNKEKPKRFMEETIDDEHYKKKNVSNEGYNSNSLENNIQNNFSLDSLNNIKNKSNNKNRLDNRNLNQPRDNRNLNQPRDNRNLNQPRDNRNLNQPRYNRNINLEKLNNNNIDNISRNIDVNKLIRDNNSNILKNYYNDKKNNYDVYSNFQEGNLQQQMPTIQIVNVQEAPKDKKSKSNKKSNLKDNVDNLLEKSVNDFDFENPIRKQYNLKQNLENLLEKSTNEITRSYNSVNKNKNINSRIKSRKNVTPYKKTKKSKTKINHFKDFMNDYTENIIVHDNFKKTKPVRSKKKCKNSNFISKFENKTKNHNIFK